jgi:general secretion pathway protein N
MIRYATIAKLATALLACGCIGAAVAATPLGALDPAESASNPGALDLTEPARPAVPTARERTSTGNPLWAVPLRVLSATRERPIFSPSRRPPAPPVVAAPQLPPPRPPAAKPAEPDHPPLTIVGTIIGETQGIGVFIDQATQQVVRLKTGQDHDGWILRSVQGREALFEKDRRKATLILPPPGDQSAPAQVAMPVGVAGDGTWLDGDGQRIAPPKRAAQPIGATPAAATPAGGNL